MRIIPVIGLTVGMTSLWVQLYILNPWHDVISKQINRLENKIDKLDNTVKK
jgi:hypothetical protein